MTAETSDRNGVSEASGAELVAKAGLDSTACIDLTNAAGDSDRIARGKEEAAKDDAYGSYVIVDGESVESVDVSVADPEEDGEKKRFSEEKAVVEVDAGSVMGELKVETEDVGEEKGRDGEFGKENGHDLQKVTVEEQELKEVKEENRECCRDNNGHDVDRSVEFCEEQLRVEPQESQEEKGECSSDDVQSIKISEECSGDSRVELQDFKGEVKGKGECWNEDGHDADHGIEVREEKEEEKEEGGCFDESCDVDDNKVECQEEPKHELQMECHEELVSELEGSKEENGECHEELIGELQGSKEENGECHEELIGELQGSKGENGELQGLKEERGEEENGECTNDAEERWEVLKVESQELQESRDNGEFCEDRDVDDNLECLQESKVELEAECHEKYRVVNDEPQELEENRDSSEFCNENGCDVDNNVECKQELIVGNPENFHADRIAECCKESSLESKEIEEESRDNGADHVVECCKESNLESKEIEEKSRDNGDCRSDDNYEVDHASECCIENREFCNERQESCELKVEKGENDDVEAIVEHKDVEIVSNKEELQSAVDVEDHRDSEIITIEVADEVHELKNQVEFTNEVDELKNQAEFTDEVDEIKNQVETEQVTTDADDREIEVKNESIESREEVQESKLVNPSPSQEESTQEGSTVAMVDAPPSLEDSTPEGSTGAVSDSIKVDAGEDSTQEGSSAPVSDSKRVDAEVGKRMPCFIIRVPRYINDKNNMQIDLAAQEVEKRTQHRDSFRDAIKLKRDSCNECRDILESARSEEKAARGAILAKRQEISTLQATINKMKDATSIDEIEEKIHNMEHKIEHETMSLKEEKQLIREIKQLKKDREELCAKTGAQSELQDTFEQKDDIEKRFKSLKQELDSLRLEVSRAENVTKLAKQKFDAEYKSLFELKEKFKDADVLRQDAYEHLVNLRKQLYEKNKYFRMYNEDKKTAWNYASTRNRDALQLHCSNQVEKIMELWNNDDEFRNDYIKNNMRSTLRRLNTLDGRSLGPDEKPPVLDLVEERTGNAIAVTSNVEQENPDMPLVAAKVDPKPTSDAGQKNSLAKSKKPNKVGIAESGQTAVPGRVDSDEQEKERIRAKEEEEVARKAEEEVRKEQELARREEELRKEEAAAKLKEQRKMEEKVKAKEAEERKRRNAEKAQARAELRVRREAEVKEKEREKRLRKKEKKKAAAASDGTSGSTEGESAPAANLSTPETTRELDIKEKPTTAVKRPAKPQSAAKQQTPRPLPLPLRNRGKRKMQPWMWVVAVALLCLTLAFVANFFELSVPSFGF